MNICPIRNDIFWMFLSSFYTLEKGFKEWPILRKGSNFFGSDKYVVKMYLSILCALVKICLTTKEVFLKAMFLSAKWPARHWKAAPVGTLLVWSIPLRRLSAIMPLSHYLLLCHPAPYRLLLRVNSASTSLSSSWEKYLDSTFWSEEPTLYQVGIKQVCLAFSG